jgi:hypothetical protein
VTYERSILNSNPSPDIKRLLDSARLDVPTPEGKARARTMTLLALRQRQVGSTTQLSAFALGETVNRLLGAVTLSNRKASAFHLALRGAAVGVVMGAAALTVIATGRWLSRPTPDSAPAMAAQPVSDPQAKEAAPRLPSPTDSLPLGGAAVRDAQSRFDAGDPKGAMLRLDEAEKELASIDGAAKRPLPVVLLRIRCLAALGRTEEARVLGDRAIQEARDARAAAEVKALLESLPATH